nr:hypothetical protein [Actinomycetota bacterium]
SETSKTSETSETSAASETSETSETSEAREVTPTRDRPDLDAVKAKIDDAQQAEDHLMDVMPGAVDQGPDVDDNSRVQTEGGSQETKDTSASGGFDTATPKDAQDESDAFADRSDESQETNKRDETEGAERS